MLKRLQELTECDPNGSLHGLSIADIDALYEAIRRWPLADERDAAVKLVADEHNAWAIMVKRRWYVVPYPDGSWFVRGDDGLMSAEADRFADNPFDAVIKADEWFREHVEKGQTP